MRPATDELLILKLVVDVPPVVLKRDLDAIARQIPIRHQGVRLCDSQSLIGGRFREFWKCNNRSKVSS